MSEKLTVSTSAGTFSATTSTTLSPSTKSAIVLVVVVIGVLGSLVLMLALLRCYHKRKNRAYREARLAPKTAPHTYIRMVDVTPRMNLVPEPQEQHPLGTSASAPPPSYHDAMSARNSPVLIPSAGSPALRQPSPTFLHPRSPVKAARTPSPPPAAASSPLLGPRHY